MAKVGSNNNVGKYMAHVELPMGHYQLSYKSVLIDLGAGFSITIATHTQQMNAEGFRNTDSPRTELFSEHGSACITDQC